MPEHLETRLPPPYRHLTAHRLRDAYADERVRHARHPGLAAMRAIRPGPNGHVIRDADGRDLGVIVRCVSLIGGVQPRQWVIIPAVGPAPKGYWPGIYEAASHLALMAGQAAIKAQRVEDEWLARPDDPVEPGDQAVLDRLTEADARPVTPLTEAPHRT